MIVNCPSCQQGLNVTLDHANTKVACPGCATNIQMPDRLALEQIEQSQLAPQVTAPQHSPTPPRTIQRRGTPSKRAPVEPSKRKFSFRILFATILAGLLMLSNLALTVAPLVIAFGGDSEVMQGAKRGYAAAMQVDPDSLNQAHLGALSTQWGIVLFFSAVAFIGILRRSRTLALVGLVLSTLFLLGKDQIPILPILAIILVIIPGQSKAWAPK